MLVRHDVGNSKTERPYARFREQGGGGGFPRRVCGLALAGFSNRPGRQLC